jgi:uncharacterized membrane protein
MYTFIKWFVAALIAVFLWLVGMYTAEYFDFNPYKKYKLPEFD